MAIRYNATASGSGKRPRGRPPSGVVDNMATLRIPRTLAEELRVARVHRDETTTELVTRMWEAFKRQQGKDLYQRPQDILEKRLAQTLLNDAEQRAS